MATMCMLSKMLHYAEQTILWLTLPVLPVLVEYSKTQRWCDKTIRDGQHFVKFNEFFHLDRTVSVDEPLQLNAEHVRQLTDKLLVRCSDNSALVLIVVNATFFEVGLKARRQCIVTVSGYLQVEHEERFMLHIHNFGALDVELSLQDSAKDVTDEAWVEEELLVLLV